MATESLAVPSAMLGLQVCGDDSTSHTARGDSKNSKNYCIFYVIKKNTYAVQYCIDFVVQYLKAHFF